MNAYEILRDACATLSDRGNTPMMRAKGDRALAALAELERAAGEPVATVCLITDRFAHNHCVEAQLQVDPGAQLPVGTKLYALPPAPVAEIREPTPEECARICTEYERLLMREGTCGGRDAFDAVRAVMWPKSEAK